MITLALLTIKQVSVSFCLRRPHLCWPMCEFLWSLKVSISTVNVARGGWRWGRGDLKERVLRLWRDLCWGYAGGVWVTGRWGSSYSGRRFLLFFCFHQLEKFRIQVNDNKFYNIICPQTHTFHQHDSKCADLRIQHFVHLWYIFFW